MRRYEGAGGGGIGASAPYICMDLICGFEHHTVFGKSSLRFDSTQRRLNFGTQKVVWNYREADGLYQILEEAVSVVRDSLA